MTNINVCINQKRSGRNILIKDVDFDLQEGTSTLVIGTSGSGKSTLESAILGFSRFKGKVQYDNKHAKVAYIAQHPSLNMRETVFQSIYYSGRYENRSQSVDLVKAAADYYIELLGLSYVRNKIIAKLSGGQRQRVAIATELIRNADVLICDEPDTGLDCGVSLALARHITKIAKEKNMTTLVVSHNVYNAKFYDRLLVLAKDDSKIGGIAFWGSPADALDFFHVTDYAEILELINPKEEDGRGLGGYYIDRFKEVRNRYM